MRRKFVAGNWKMNLDVTTARALARRLKQQLTKGDQSNSTDVAVCPAFLHLPAVVEILAQSRIAIGAQDAYSRPNGAFTGEISVDMLKDAGVSYVIVGHSERRRILAESDECINQKLLAVLAGGLSPIFCVGELLDERENDQTEMVIDRQLRQGLVDIAREDLSKVTIAYEPVWAIGTGKTATASQAQEVHAFIRRKLADLFDNPVAQNLRIQYGGSVRAGNAGELMAGPDVDGVLVGSASLNADNFSAIVQSSVQCEVN